MRIDGLPAWLGERHRLFELFRPNERTASYFAVVVALMKRPKTWQKALDALASSLTAFEVRSSPAGDAVHTTPPVLRASAAVLAPELR